MAEPVGDDWITVPAAARMLGIDGRTVYRLIDRGELRAEVSVPDHRPKQRRLIRLRRQDAIDYVERARVKPGELHGLYPPLRRGKYR